MHVTHGHISTFAQLLESLPKHGLICLFCWLLIISTTISLIIVRSFIIFKISGLMSVQTRRFVHFVHDYLFDWLVTLVCKSMSGLGCNTRHKRFNLRILANPCRSLLIFTRCCCSSLIQKHHSLFIYLFDRRIYGRFCSRMICVLRWDYLLPIVHFDMHLLIPYLRMLFLLLLHQKSFLTLKIIILRLDCCLWW